MVSLHIQGRFTLQVHESSLHNDRTLLKVPAVRRSVAEWAAAVAREVAGESFALCLQLVCCLEPPCRVCLDDVPLHGCGIIKPAGADAAVLSQFLRLLRVRRPLPSSSLMIDLILRIIQGIPCVGGPMRIRGSPRALGRFPIKIACTVVALNMTFECKPGGNLQLGKSTNRMNNSCVRRQHVEYYGPVSYSMLTHLFGRLELQPTFWASELRCSIIQRFSMWGLVVVGEPTDKASDLPQDSRCGSDVKWI